MSSRFIVLLSRVKVSCIYLISFPKHTIVISPSKTHIYTVTQCHIITFTALKEHWKPVVIRIVNEWQYLVSWFPLQVKSLRCEYMTSGHDFKRWPLALYLRLDALKAMKLNWNNIMFSLLGLIKAIIFPIDWKFLPWVFAMWIINH